jgi:hypothetical protein
MTVAKYTGKNNVIYEAMQCSNPGSVTRYYILVLCCKTYKTFFESPGTELVPTKTKKKLNSMVRVRERTIPTERSPLVGEVIANFCR